MERVGALAKFIDVHTGQELTAHVPGSVEIRSGGLGWSWADINGNRWDQESVTGRWFMVEADRVVKPSERQQYLRQLAHTCSRLLGLLEDPRLVQYTQPLDYIVARHMRTMVAVTAGFCRSELREAFMEWIQDTVRRDQGRCVLCGGDVDPNRKADRVCAKCLAETDAIEAELATSAGEPTH